jgi:hypothetical protein
MEEILMGRVASLKILNDLVAEPTDVNTVSNRSVSFENLNFTTDDEVNCSL